MDHESAQISSLSKKFSKSFELDKKTNLIRDIRRSVYFNNENPQKLHSCQFYLKERKSKTNFSTSIHISNNQIIKKSAQKTGKASPPSQKAVQLNPIFHKSSSEDESFFKLLPKTDPVLNTYVRKFTFQRLNTGEGDEISLESQEKCMKTQEKNVNSSSLKIFAKNFKHSSSFESENLFSKLQATIDTELEKSLETKKRFDKQKDFMQCNKRIAESLTKFKPTTFEKSILTQKKRPSVLTEMEKIKLLKNSSKLSLQKHALANYPSTFNSIAEYQRVYRQFNHSKPLASIFS